MVYFGIGFSPQMLLYFSGRFPGVVEQSSDIPETLQTHAAAGVCTQFGNILTVLTQRLFLNSTIAFSGMST